MDNSHKLMLALAALAFPAVGATAHAMLTRTTPLCFTGGTLTYQISAATPADVAVRIDNASTNPDLRIRLVDQPDEADLILADDQTMNENTACAGSALKTVRIVPGSTRSDVTVALASDGAEADASIYVRSARFSTEQAAALKAAMWTIEQRARIAGR